MRTQLESSDERRVRGKEMGDDGSPGEVRAEVEAGGPRMAVEAEGSLGTDDVRVGLRCDGRRGSWFGGLLGERIPLEEEEEVEGRFCLSCSGEIPSEMSPRVAVPPRDLDLSPPSSDEKTDPAPTPAAARSLSISLTFSFSRLSFSFELVDDSLNNPKPKLTFLPVPFDDGLGAPLSSSMRPDEVDDPSPLDPAPVFFMTSPSERWREGPRFSMPPMSDSRSRGSEHDGRENLVSRE